MGKLQKHEEVDLQKESEKLAEEVGDSLSKFLEVTHREIKKIRFKDFNTTYVDINFQLGGSDLVTIKFATIQVTGMEEKSTMEKEEDSRCFTIPKNKKDLSSYFWLILMWRERMLRDHADKHKKRQQELFS